MDTVERRLDFLTDDGRRMSALVAMADIPASSGLCFVAHGLKSAADAPHITKIRRAYINRCYIVIAPNICNSNANDSDGTLETFTIRDHIDGVRRTIEWARENADLFNWDARNFVMAGHSMGAYASGYLAAREYGAQCRHLLLVSPTTSGERSLRARSNERINPGAMDIMRRETPLLEQEWPQHDAYRHADGIIMPAAIAVGSIDTLTPPSDIDDFAAALPCCIDKRIVPDEHHCLVGGGITAMFGQMIGNLELAAAPRYTPRKAPAP